MRVLFLTQILPYPPDAGPKVKTWHVLRYLETAGHEVELVSFVRPEEAPYLEFLEQVCTKVHAIPIRRSRIADLWHACQSLLNRRPFLVQRDDTDAMRKKVRALLDSAEFDIAHADQLTMAQFLLPPLEQTAWRGGVRLIFDAHNAVWAIMEQVMRTAPLPIRPFLWLEARKLKAYEGKVVSQFDHTLAVTKLDQEALLHAAANVTNGRNQTAISVIPIAVDTDSIVPQKRKIVPGNIMTLGTLHYPPNADGIRWFAKEVFPQINERMPGTTLTIVGKNPPTDFNEFASNGRIRVTGYVPDLDPFMSRAEVLVVPVRSGGGMRVRLLEGFARGMPMVTTSIGLEGIDAHHDQEVLIADDAESFARETLRLLSDRALQRRLSVQGRRLAEQRYDWTRVLPELDSIYAGGQTANR